MPFPCPLLWSLLAVAGRQEASSPPTPVEFERQATEEVGTRLADIGHLALFSGGFGLSESDLEYEVGLEWRFHERLWGLRPIVGYTGIEGGQSYVYVGVRYEHVLGRDFYVAPSFAAGSYNEDSGLKLGGPIEFRSALEIGWRRNRWSSIGLTLYHLSNGGLYDTNHGSESLVLSFGVDLLALFAGESP